MMFYWLTILFTFALGTATGDLMAEVLGLGYLVMGVIVAALISVIAIASRLGINSVLSFWFLYILTRPLGASIGDYLSQPASQGGLALGATVTSLIFVAGIIGIVVHLSVTKADVIASAAAMSADEAAERGGLLQTVVVLVLVLVAAGTGYTLRKAALQDDTSVASGAVQAGSGGSSPAHVSPLGDLSVFQGVTRDTLNLLNAGDQAGATARVDDLELDWDNAEARLKPKDPAAWSTVDGRIDKVLRELRATSPDPVTEKAALDALLTALP